MKRAHLTYHRTFPWSPVSSATYAHAMVYRCAEMEGGRIAKPVSVPHPVLEQRKLWCLLRVEVNDIELRFATPAELDVVINTLSPKRMASRTTRQISGAFASRKNRPNDTWFSRLPGKAKSPRWRQVFLTYVARAKPVAEFREFYAADPPAWQLHDEGPDHLFSAYFHARQFYYAANYPGRVVRLN